MFVIAGKVSGRRAFDLMDCLFHVCNVYRGIVGLSKPSDSLKQQVPSVSTIRTSVSAERVW